MYRGKSVLLSAFIVVALVACGVNGRRLLPKLVGPPGNITATQRIIAHGYPAEVHLLETNDGYMLNMVRIPHSSNVRNDSQAIRRPAVLLMHGLRSCSDIFLLPGPNSGLPFLLADTGYDVWMANARGSTYSKRHRKFMTNTRRFWHFGWHEIGEIDVAAIIDYILELTAEKKIHFVGHSQGTTVYLVLMSMRPEYNEKIKTAHLLAPMAFQSNTTSAFLRQIAPIISRPGKWNGLVRDREIPPGNRYLQSAIYRGCQEGVLQPKVCLRMLHILFEEEIGNLNMTVVPLFIQTHPASASTNQLLHYNQLYLADQFRQFDYGYEENMKRYGQPSPPNYELDKVTSSIYIYYSDYDSVSTGVDVQRLAHKLPNLKLNHRVSFPNWRHIDFLLGVDVKSQIFDPVIKTCIEYDQLQSQ